MVNTKASGSKGSRDGLNYEKELKLYFENVQNWKALGLTQDILSRCEIPFELIDKIEATTDVPLLSSGGSPKTDLIVSIFLKNKKIIKLCFSCKRSRRKQVSFHEYSADEFIDVLKIHNEVIKKLIYKHQEDGSAINFSTQEKELLKNALAPLKDTLIEWVVLGLHHKGKRENDQIVDYVICNGKLRSIEDYKSFMANKMNGFGTGFSWTRQSRGKSKTIQLKGPVF